MSYEIVPYVGASNIRIGMSRNSVRDILGKPQKSFKKTNFDTNMTDMYADFFLYYDELDRVEAVEFFGNIPVFFGAFNLMKTSFEILKNYFECVDDNIDIDNLGFTSYHFGISIYAPNWKENLSIRPESILIFAKDYFNN